MDFDIFKEISIMVVEDDSFNQELASAIFDEFKNITMIKADNGEEALKILSQQSVDLILLDLMMPKMNGFDTLKNIKESDEYKDIPVIVVTSKETERKSTYKLGANDFISKPYKPTELRMRVFQNLKIKSFFDIIKDIETNTDASSTQNLSDIQSALQIADNSPKELLSKIGNLSQSNSSERLGDYVSLLSRLYGLNNKEVDDLFYIMAIYDIGLLRIPKEKLIKLDKKEYKKHPQLGLKILEGIKETNLIKMAKIVALSHHEAWDGSGFPEGLKGDNIPIYARLVSLVDYFDKLTTYRIYDKEILRSAEALEVIKRDKGVKLDPQLVDIFENNFKRFIEIKDKYSI